MRISKNKVIGVKFVELCYFKVNGGVGGWEFLGGRKGGVGARGVVSLTCPEPGTANRFQRFGRD